LCYNGSKVNSLNKLFEKIKHYHVTKSGAGKTTLLNVLNFRNQGKLEINGDIKINGQNVNWKTIASCSGYVQQEDVY
jgi:ABC-type multidrug transport system ATPase subunit